MKPTNSHTGIYLTNLTDKEFILKGLLKNKLPEIPVDLSSMKGVLYSSITIDKMIAEELRHDHFLIHTDENESLGTMSSGQQRKALLNHLIAQQPDYMILDDLYSNIDKLTQQQIAGTLTELSENILMIQLFFRQSDVLPFIENICTVNEKNEIVSVQHSSDFLKAKELDISFRGFKLPDTYSGNHNGFDIPVRMKAVSVKYGDKPVLDNINWTIRKGEFWQLTGPNGSGKSTLVSMISGDNPKAYGQDITLFGRKKGSGETIWDIKKQIGYFTPLMIHQFTRADSVENMIISGLNDSVGLYVTPTDLQKDTAKFWLDVLGETFRKKNFQQLSVGQQRMVMVARAMVKHPPLLILDEPTIELDDNNSRLFIEMINAIAMEKQVAIIYISHRDETGLLPEKIFELIKTGNGYTGIEKSDIRLT